jgi:hypothetical protein
MTESIVGEVDDGEPGTVEVYRDWDSSGDVYVRGSVLTEFELGRAEVGFV